MLLSLSLHNMLQQYPRSKQLNKVPLGSNGVSEICDVSPPDY